MLFQTPRPGKRRCGSILLGTKRTLISNGCPSASSGVLWPRTFTFTWSPKTMAMSKSHGQIQLLAAAAFPGLIMTKGGGAHRRRDDGQRGGVFLIMCVRKHKHILTMTDHERSGCDRTRERERKLGVGWGFLYAYMVLTLNSCIRADTCSRRPCSGSTPLPLPRSRSRRRSSKCSRSLRLPRLQRLRGRPWWPRCPRRRRP